MVLLASVATGLLPAVFGRLIDVVGQAKDRESVALLIIATYVATQWFAKILLEFGQLFFGSVEQRVNHAISLQMFDGLMRLPIHLHFGRKLGSVGQTLQSGLNGLRLVLQHLSYTIAPVIVELLTVMVILGRLSPSFLLLFVATLLLQLAVFLVASKKLLRPADLIAGANADAYGILNDALTNIETIKAFGAEGTLRDRYDTALGHSESSWVRLFITRLRVGLLVGLISALALTVAMYVAFASVRGSEITTGEFVLICTYMLRIATPAQMLGLAIRDTTEATAQMNAMSGMLATGRSPELHAATDHVHLPAETPIGIEFRGVTLAYEPGRPVLDDVSFIIPPGRTIAIVGSTGSGKSSLARLLLRLAEPDSGDVVLGGLQLRSILPSQLRHLISVVPQDTVLFNETMAFNIAIGSPAATRRDILDAAAISGLMPLVGSLPDGIDTTVGERGLKLSGGERQRIAIARAVLRRPRIFIFDEATSSLDPHTENEVMGRISRLSKGTTTLLIAHRLTTVVASDEIVVLERGKIIERGSHATLMALEGRYTQLWKAQGGIHAADRIVLGT